MTKLSLTKSRLSENFYVCLSNTSGREKEMVSVQRKDLHNKSMSELRIYSQPVARNDQAVLYLVLVVSENKS